MKIIVTANAALNLSLSYFDVETCLEKSSFLRRLRPEITPRYSKTYCIFLAKTFLVVISYIYKFLPF